jgi:hypothetical protein
MSELLTITGRLADIFGSSPKRANRVMIVGEVVMDGHRTEDGGERTIINIESSMISRLVTKDGEIEEVDPEYAKQDLNEEERMRQISVLQEISMLQEMANKIRKREARTPEETLAIQEYGEPTLEQPEDMEPSAPPEFSSQMIAALKNDGDDSSGFHMHNETRSATVENPWETVSGSRLTTGDPMDPFS